MAIFPCQRYIWHNYSAKILCLSSIAPMVDAKKQCLFKERTVVKYSSDKTVFFWKAKSTSHIDKIELPNKKREKSSNAKI